MINLPRQMEAPPPLALPPSLENNYEEESGEVSDYAQPSVPSFNGRNQQSNGKEYYSEESYYEEQQPYGEDSYGE
jgi:hypothetical protein